MVSTCSFRTRRLLISVSLLYDFELDPAYDLSGGLNTQRGKQIGKYLMLLVLSSSYSLPRAPSAPQELQKGKKKKEASDKSCECSFMMLPNGGREIWHRMLATE